MRPKKGIYDHRDFQSPYYERPPYHQRSIRSVYHVREYELAKLRALGGGEPVDVFLSHDWPVGITEYGDERALLSRKPYFGEDIRKGELGNPHTLSLLKQMKPAFWFSAHLHCKFAALVPHEEKEQKEDDGEEEDETAAPTTRYTRFLALDKCLPNRSFLQVLNIPIDTEDAPPVIEMDPEWLCILKKAQPSFPTSRNPSTGPIDASGWSVSEEEVSAMREHIMQTKGSMEVLPCPHYPELESIYPHFPSMVSNPQTDDLLAILGLEHAWTEPMPSHLLPPPPGSSMHLPPPPSPSSRIHMPPAGSGSVSHNPEEINLDEEEGEGGSIDNPEEIDLDDL